MSTPVRRKGKTKSRLDRYRKSRKVRDKGMTVHPPQFYSEKHGQKMRRRTKPRKNGGGLRSHQ